MSAPSTTAGLPATVHTTATAVRIFPLHGLTDGQRTLLRAGQQEAGAVYTECMQAHRIARQTRSPWPAYNDLHHLTKGRHPDLCAQSVQATCRAFDTTIKCTIANRKAGNTRLRYPWKERRYQPIRWPAQALQRKRNGTRFPLGGRGKERRYVDLPIHLPSHAGACQIVWSHGQYELHVCVTHEVATGRESETRGVAHGHACIDLGEIVRHEVACVIVRRKDRTRCPIICTLRGTAFRQRDVECPRTMDPQPQGWYANREGRVHLRASMGKGTRVDGMASISEPLISIVTRYEAKDADRLRLQRVRGLISPTSWAPNAVGVERAPNPILLHMRNVVSPSGSLWESDSQEKLIARRVWDGGESESRPVMGRIGVAR